MKKLVLGTNFTYQELPNTDFVVYSTDGSAKPFVLTGKAKTLFDELLKVSSIDENDLISKLIGKGIAEIETRAIVENFQTEGIFLNKIPKTIAAGTKKQSKHLTFWVHVTNMCNLKCGYCYICKELGKMSIALIDEFLGFLAERCSAKRLKTVTFKFAGGEPTLEVSLIRYIVSEAKKVLLPYGVIPRFTMITNGTLLTKEICEFLYEEKFTISVSVDGLGDYNNERLYPNGKQSLQDTLNGIDLLQKHGIDPYILTVVSNTSVGGIKQLIEYMVSKGLSVNLILSRDLDDDGELLLDLDLMQRELIPVLRQVVRFSEDKLPNLSFSTVGLNGKRKRACSGGQTYFVVGHDGKISTCPMAVTKIGDGNVNIERDFNSVRATFHPKERSEACKKCIWKYACAGGCDVVAKKSPATSTPVPFCSIMGPILQELLFLEGRKIQTSKRR